MSREQVSGDRTESFAEKARVAADDHARALRFLRGDIAGNAGDCAADVGESKFLGHDGAPS